MPWTLASALSRMVLSLVGTVLLVRYLTPSEYGVWALLIALGAPVYLFVSFGFQHKLSRFLPGLDDSRLMAEIVWSVSLRRLLWTVLASVLLIAAFPLYAERLGLEHYFEHVCLYQVALIGNIGSMYVALAFSARFLQREVLLMTVPRQIVSVALTLVGIQMGQDLLFFVGLASLIATINLAVCVWMLARQFGTPPWRSLWRGGPEPEEVRHYRRASYIGDYGVTFLNTEVDRYLIAVFSQSAEVAIYAVSTTIVERLRAVLPSQLLRPLMEATFFRRYEETGRAEELVRMFRLLLLIITSVCFLFVAIFAPLGRELLAFVFRPDYAAGYWIVMLYLMAMALHQMPAGLILKALKRADVLVYAQVAIFLNLALGLLLVPIWGGIGMAIATIVSVTLKNLIMYLWSKRLIEISFPWLGLTKIAAATLAAVAFVEWLKVWTAFGDQWAVLVYVPVAMIVYLGMLRVLSPLDAEQKSLLISVMPPGMARPFGLVLG